MLPLVFICHTVNPFQPSTKDNGSTSTGQLSLICRCVSISVVSKQSNFLKFGMTQHYAIECSKIKNKKALYASSDSHRQIV